MKILQISTPFLPVSPDLKYGGAERMVYLLDSELYKLGFSAGVVAPGDSNPASFLHKTIENSIGVDNEKSLRDVWRNTYLKFVHIEKAIEYAKQLRETDIVHLHDENVLFFDKNISLPGVLTLHSNFDLFWEDCLKEFIQKRRTRFVAISKSQKRMYESNGIRIDYVVYNGVDEENFSLSETKRDYLLTLGSVQERKGQKDAIEVGKRTELDLIIAGNIGNQKYFEEKIKPHITHDLTKETDKLAAYMSLSSKSPKVVYVGPVNDKQKAPLYSSAKAFLMPLHCEEPFGLVMVEAMMSGTPVIGYNINPILEIICQGKTGFIVKNLDGMVDALSSVNDINPAECRALAVSRFSKSVMADNYLQVYQDILSQSKPI